jgi:hypothetical protein
MEDCTASEKMYHGAFAVNTISIDSAENDMEALIDALKRASQGTQEPCVRHVDVW